MFHQDNKLRHANVIAGFESQDDAEEAILGLRMAGLPDSRIGYFFASTEGEMEDQLSPYHRFTGSVIGTIVGAVAGWMLARWVIAFGFGIDPFGLAITSAVTGAFFFGMMGGFMGFWFRQPEDEAFVGPSFSEPYVISVDAGVQKEETWTLLRKHGGHELAA